MPAGRPSDYKPEYCDQIVEFFSIEPSYQITETMSGKNWEKQEVKDKPNRLPTFERFAFKIGTTHTTMSNWCKQFPEFLAAYNTCKELQKDFLIQNGITGLFNPHFTQFVAKNITDMKDKTEQDISHTVSGVKLKFGE